MSPRGTQYGFRITSLGVTGTDRLVHFMSGPDPTWDTDGVWCHCLPHGRFPGQIAEEIDPATGRSTIGGVTFEVTADAALSNGTTVAQMLYSLTPVAVANLEAVLAYGSTDVQTDDNTGSLAGVEVFIAETGEVVRLGTHAGVGLFQNCTRGVWGTRAQTVSAGTTESGNPALYDPTTGPVLAYRQIEYLRVNMDTATSYSDVEVLWVGVVDPLQIARPSPGLITIGAESMLGMLEARKILVSPWRTELQPPRVAEVGGSRNRIGAGPITRREWTALGETDRAPSTTSNMLLSLDGEAIMVVPTLTQVGGGRYRGTFDELDQYEIAGQSPLLPDEPRKAWETHHHTGTDPGALPYHRNLLTSFLQVLLSTREGNNDATYDVGGDTAGDEDYGVGIPADLVDVARIEEIRARLGRRLIQTRNFFNFAKHDGVEVLKWYQERLLPYGIWITQRGTKLSLALMDDSPLQASVTLTETDDILGPSSAPPRSEPAHVRRADLATSSIRAEFAFIPGLDVRTDTYVDAVRTRTHRFSDQDAPLFNLHGVDNDRDVSQICALALLRYKNDLGEATFSVLRTSAESFDAGDLIKVTHAKIPNSAGGARGVTNAAFLVTLKEPDLSQNTTTIRGLDVGSIYETPGLISPALVVNTYDAGTPAQIVAYTNAAAGGFQSGLLDGDPRDVPEDASDVAVGDLFDHCDEHGNLREADFTVTGVATGGVVDFDKTPATAPIQGDLFLPVGYDNASSRQKSRYAALADSGGQLGTGNDPGNQYTAY